MRSQHQIIAIDDSTVFTSATASANYLLSEMNGREIGIPLYSFTNLPLDFVFAKADLRLTDATLVTEATAYNAAVAITVNSSGVAIPIYQVAQTDTDGLMQVATPTIVQNLTATGQFVAVNINDTYYGVPLQNWGTIYPSTSTTPMSSTAIQSVLMRQFTQDVGEGRGSTNLNSKIRAYSHLIERIKYQMGHPYVSIEVCEDTQMVDFIDQALEWYTKYAGYTEEYLIFSSGLYEEPGLRIDKLFTLTTCMRETQTGNISGSWDYDLDEYRKVIGIFAMEQGETTGINELFTLEQAMAQQTYFSYMLGNVGFDLVTWEVLKGWLDTREKVLAQQIYVDFDNRNQRLRLIPAPYSGQTYYGVVGAWVEKPIRDIIMERWVYQYALSLTKIAVGNIRGKYGTIQLFGGGTINYNDLLSQGLEEKKQLEEEIMNGYGEVTPSRFWIG